LDSIRNLILHNKSFNSIETEISIGECQNTEPILREFNSNSIFKLKSDLDNSVKDDHFFLFFTDSQNCIASGISNPNEKKHETWIRVINRSFGTELIPPRRLFQNSTIP
jgi:hypothetical protein